jgi:hypothetical protein
MSDTLVVQSHREPLPFSWLEACLDSVAGWARWCGYDYRFVGDEIFDRLAPPLRDRLATRPVIASDLARLRLLQQGLVEGYRRVVWCDADWLIFRPGEFLLPQTGFAPGREVWIQDDGNGGLRSYFRVHNALLLFARDNTFLDFYTATAERLLSLNEGPMPPQFVGPKLLSALHNIAHFPVMEGAAMLSPLVIRDLLDGGGRALDLFRDKSVSPPAGANLCASLAADEGFGESEMKRLIDLLLEDGIP